MKTDNSSPSILQFQDFCRTCLQEVDVKINIFKYVLQDDSVLVSEALRVALPIITVQENDKLPQQMCSDCLVALSQTYAFIKKCLETHETLMTCLDVIDNKEEHKSGAEELITIINDEFAVKENADAKTNESEVELELEIRESAGDIFGDDEAESVKYFNCHLCKNIDFAEKDDLVRHLKTHEEFAKPYECDKCERRFNLKHNLMRHQLLHKGVKRFSCPRCDKAFSSRHQRNIHLRVHRPAECFMCERCGSRHKYEHLLKQHQKRCLKPQFPPKPPQDTEESENATNRLKLETAGTGFLCDDCGKYLKTKVALRLHMRVHTGEKPYTCADCHRTFSQGSSLIYHRRTHTGEKPYCCGVCLRTFTQPAHLKTHMKTHTGEKPFTCPFCSKDFALKKNMIVHTRIHTGEKPFACSVCDKKFVDPSSRKKHFRKHHVLKIGEEVQVGRLKGLAVGGEQGFKVEEEEEGVQVTPVYIVKSEI